MLYYTHSFRCTIYNNSIITLHSQDAASVYVACTLLHRITYVCTCTYTHVCIRYFNVYAQRTYMCRCYSYVAHVMYVRRCCARATSLYNLCTYIHVYRTRVYICMCIVRVACTYVHTYVRTHGTYMYVHIRAYIHVYVRDVHTYRTIHMHA